MAQELSFDLTDEPRGEGEDRPFSSTSTDSKARSTCCWSSPAARRSISRASPFWRSPSNISPSSRRRAACASSLPPTISSWRPGSPILKSRLLLPEPPKGDEPSAADLAAALAERLRRLEAIRDRRRQAHPARAARPRHVFARRAGGDRDDLATDVSRRASSICSRPTPVSAKRPRHRASRCASAPSGRWPRRARRWSGSSASRRNGPCSTIFCCIIVSICRRRARCAPRPSPLRSKWCGKGVSTCVRTGPSRRSGCGVGADRSGRREDFAGVS